MNRLPWQLGFTLVLLVASFAAAKDGPSAPTATPEGLEFFETKIRPVLVDSCYQCHSAEAGPAKVKGELLLDSREGMLKGGQSGKPAIVPGNADASLLVEAIRHTNSELQMPPKKKLGERQVADFVTWINLGAPDPRTGGGRRRPA